MKYMYCLMHTYDNLVGEPESKTIGYFLSEEEAKVHIDHYKTLPGFRDHTEGFIVCKIEIGRIWWEEGFETLLDNEPI